MSRVLLIGGITAMLVSFVGLVVLLLFVVAGFPIGLAILMLVVTIAMCAVWEHAGYERGRDALQTNYKREGFGPDT